MQSASLFVWYPSLFVCLKSLKWQKALTTPWKHRQNFATAVVKCVVLFCMALLKYRYDRKSALKSIQLRNCCQQFFVYQNIASNMSKLKTISMLSLIATDKRGYPHNFFLFLDKNICCGYSLEVPRWGASNEYPQHMFSLRNKEDISIFRMKKAPYLLLWSLVLLNPDMSCICKQCRSVNEREAVRQRSTDKERSR